MTRYKLMRDLSLLFSVSGTLLVAHVVFTGNPEGLNWGFLNICTAWALLGWDLFVTKRKSSSSTTKAHRHNAKCHPIISGKMVSKVSSDIVVEGMLLTPDDTFDCLATSADYLVMSATGRVQGQKTPFSSLYINCDNDKHYLDGQLSVDDKGNYYLVGLSRTPVSPEITLCEDKGVVLVSEQGTEWFAFSNSDFDVNAIPSSKYDKIARYNLIKGLWCWLPNDAYSNKQELADRLIALNKWK